jgi:undecaprenyl-diphosphatase
VYVNEAVLLWLNQLNGTDDLFGKLLRLAREDYLKSLPFMLVFWALWFWSGPEERTAARERLVAVLLTSVTIIAVTRALANHMPFSVRPLHSDLPLRLAEFQFAQELDGWSSMPSDHASLFMGLAVGLMLCHRWFGMFLVVWSVFVVSLPRIIFGYHWPTDIVVGWIIGAGLALALHRPLTALVRSTGVVPYFEAREALGYPLLFLATFEVARMFWMTRFVVLAIIN